MWIAGNIIGTSFYFLLRLNLKMVDLYEDIEDGEDGDANVRVMPPSNVSLCTKLLRNERQVNAPSRVGRGEVG